MAPYASNRTDFYRRFYSELIRRYWKSDPKKRSRKPPQRNWLDFGAGKTGVKFGWSFHRRDRFSAEIYIDTGDRKTNLAYLDLLRKACSPRGVLRSQLSWEPLPKRRACRIADYHPAEVEALMGEPEKLEQLLQWAISKMHEMEAAFGAAIPDL